MITFKTEELRQCFRFASDMRGNHNPNIIGKRDDWEIFRDDFRGKLGELAVAKYIRNNIPNAKITGDIDFKVTPRGQWDITDIIINNRYYNVKSIKPNSNFLLVETLRYDKYGNYSYPNNDNTPVKIDGYILVKVNVYPDVQKNIFSQSFENFCANGYDSRLKKSVKRTFSAEIVGGISHKDFWQYKAYAPKGIRCDYLNLNAITEGCDINNLPSQLSGTESKNLILQTNNYVIGKNHLTNLSTFISSERLIK